ncbi:hypothetical protein FHS27_006174 [Rhodopirellula rubra]|uniref:Zinc-finger domain-containing protein n=1 Tax=Aporhodopirellula rubra TaxID=980271 RepID=A0A7W5E5S8_9BACT|nr:zf-HC2 domain-containing protein [Aporhodopirellula rubra]MBB3210327.1 hypothetical protein [Aporhodopirellula rubra]
MTEPEIIDSDDELLVAYLDGELAREERDAVENRLIGEEPLRQRLQDLQRSWDMLEWLPNPIPDEKSVQTTLQLVVADLNPTGDRSSRSKSSDTIALSHDKRRAFGGWLPLLVPLLVAAIAFGVTRWRQIKDIRSQLADFPVAMDMDAYAIGKDADLVNDLMASKWWRGVVGGSVTPAVDAIISPAKSPQSLYPQSDNKTQLPDRETLASALEEVPTQQRIVALARLDRFSRLDESEKELLRETAERVRSSDQPNKRLQTMRQYVRLREQLSDDVIARIENETGVERQQAIDDAIEEAITQIGRVTGRNLSEDAIERIDYTVIQLVKNRISRATGDDGRNPVSALVEFFRRRGRGGDSKNAYRMFAMATLLKDSNWVRGQGRSFRGGPPQDFEAMPPLSQRELETIQSMLPSEDLEMLQLYVSDPWMQNMVVRDWTVEALRRKLRGEAKPPSLTEQYDSMPLDQREALDLSPPDVVRKALIEGL